MTITTKDIELSIAKLFDIRRNMIVPNVSWGLNLHECDLLIVTKTGYAIEVEIKTSKSDLVRDKEKPHGHNSKKIKLLYFAIPDVLRSYIDTVPCRAGIIVIEKNTAENTQLYQRWITTKTGYFAKVIRQPQPNKFARKLTIDEMIHLGRLASMRLWKDA